MRISDWSSDVCSSDLPAPIGRRIAGEEDRRDEHQHEIGDAAARRDRIAARPRRDAREIVAADLGQFAHALSQPIAVQKGFDPAQGLRNLRRSEEHTSELQSLMRNSYAVFCLKKKKNKTQNN